MSSSRCSAKASDPSACDHRSHSSGGGLTAAMWAHTTCFRGGGSASTWQSAAKGRPQEAGPRLRTTVLGTLFWAVPPVKPP